MSDPQNDTVISLLRNIALGQTETNTLLRRIVPDQFDFPGGLYDMVRRGLYRVTVQGENPPVFNPLPELLAAALTEQLSGQSLAANVAQTAALSLEADNKLGQLLSETALLSTFLNNQLSPGVGSLNISELLSAINQNSGTIAGAIGTSAPGSTGDGILGKLDRVGNLILSLAAELVYLEPGSNQTYNVSQLLYALGLCQCEDFPSLPGPTDPGDTSQPSVFLGTCATLAKQVVIRCTEVVASGTQDVGGTIYNRFVCRWPESGAVAGTKQFLRAPGTTVAYRIQDTNTEIGSAGLHTAFPDGLQPAFIRRIGPADVTTVASTSNFPSSTGMPALPRGCNSQVGNNIANPSAADPIWFGIRLYYPQNNTPPTSEMRHVYIVYDP